MTALVLMVVAGCKGEPEPVPVVEACPEDSWVRYENFAEPLIKNWCLPCHSSQLDAPFRQGAPVGVDFDTFDAAAQWSDRIVARTVTLGDMPPVAGPTAEERASLAEWVACGLPGTSEPTVVNASCATLVWVDGDAGEDVCDFGNAVTGDLTIDAQADLACLCEVSGRLTVAAGSLDAPLLTTIGGDMEVSGPVSAVSVPALASVGGALNVHDAGTLAVLDLRGLRTAGSVTLSELGNVARLDFARLESVPGDLTIAHGPGLTEIANTDALLTVGGDLSFTDLPALGALGAFARLTEVGGDLSLRETGLFRWSGLASLTTVGGALRVANNPALTEIAAVPSVATIGGALEIEGNPLLDSIAGFPVLETVGSLAFTDLAALRELEGPPALVNVTGDLVIDQNAGLSEVTGFDALSAVGGTLRLSDNPLLVRIADFGALSTLGSLEIARDAQLQSADMLAALTTAGDVVIVDVPALGALPPMVALSVVGDFLVQNTGVAHLLGPQTLETVQGDLSIDSNPALASIAGLAAVDDVQGSVAVTDNVLLSTAEATAFVAGIQQIGGSVEVSGNAP